MTVSGSYANRYHQPSTINYHSFWNPFLIPFNLWSLDYSRAWTSMLNIIQPLVPSTIGIVHEVVNPVGGGDRTSTSVGAAGGIPTHLPHISLPKQLLILHIC
ncbi:uncharacterized protein N7487_000754 [Penicillium crustosum]|uniref:uncharacterized protein n=1 Tax=Penicillium crustosum TaxID=36656 RepID=UPI0023986CBB|nr:uncharacterized protein N7487_000754 [Penicillium crustosum]KAJ5417204.1 hypothetical protein N7487_000754 [Penicillium crustosum]